MNDVTKNVDILAQNFQESHGTVVWKQKIFTLWQFGRLYVCYHDSVPNPLHEHDIL